MVVLNTNLYYDQNDETAGEEDPAGQFQWLEETLSNAARADEMVLKEINKENLQRGFSQPGSSSRCRSSLGAFTTGPCSGGRDFTSSCFGRSTSWGTSLLASSRRNEASPGSGAASMNDT